MSQPIDELRALWPVPNLSVLLPAELIAVLQHHFTTCGKDHQAMKTAAPNVSAIDFPAEVFVCNTCDGTEPFALKAAEAASADDYVCGILQQGARFNQRHFEICFRPKGGAQ